MKKISIVLFLICASSNAMEQSKEESTNWDSLPIELKLHIFSFLPSILDGTEFNDLRLVGTETTQLINDPMLIPQFQQAFRSSGVKKSYNEIAVLFARACNAGNQSLARMIARIMIKQYPQETVRLVSDYFDHKTYEKVKLFLEAGFDPNIQSTCSRYAGLHFLMVAVESGKIDFAKLFIEYGANVNAQEADGWTPLLGAVDYYLGSHAKHIEIIKLLLDHGADPLAITAEGTALSYAQRYEPRFDSVIKLLEAYADR
jgi:hypothetical protein